MNIPITPKQRSELRARAHALPVVVIVGAAGLTPAVLGEIGKALTSRDLVKIRVFSDDRTERDSMLNEICASLSAAPVQHVGKTLVIYRPLAEKKPSPVAKIPRRRKPARRTKRSFQGH